MAKILKFSNTKLTDSQQKTQSAFVTVNFITGQCQAILNTQFVAPSKKPSWFDDLNAKLQVAKDLAGQWINGLSIDVASSIPSQVINYGTTFMAAIDQIHELYQKDPLAKGADNPTIKQVADIMNLLSDQVLDLQSSAADVQKKLIDWGEKMQKAHDNLLNGATSIQNTIIDLNTDVEKMDSAIAENKSLIEQYNKAIIASAAAIGVGLFMLVAGIALCIATAGTAAVVAGGVAAGGAAAIIGGAITWGIMQNKINSAYDDIAQEQKEKTEDQQQIVALKALAASASAAITSIELSKQALSELEVTWQVYSNELSDVAKKLKRGTSMTSIIGEKVMADAARNEWEQAVKLSQDLVGSKVPVESKVLKIGDKVAA